MHFASLVASPRAPELPKIVSPVVVSGRMRSRRQSYRKAFRN